MTSNVPRLSIKDKRILLLVQAIFYHSYAYACWREIFRILGLYREIDELSAMDVYTNFTMEFINSVKIRRSLVIYANFNVSPGSS